MLGEGEGNVPVQGEGVVLTRGGGAAGVLEGVRAVLLDMDGTLVDSDAAVERSWRTWAVRYGLSEDAVVAAVHGYPAPASIRRLLPRLSGEELEEAAQVLLDLECADLDGVVAARGAGELLAVLAERAIPWAVVTGSGAGLAKARLAAAGITPPLLVSLDEVAVGKPDPEGYLMAAAELGVAPAACLAVEDSDPGIAAGRAAGMPVAALRGLSGDLPIAHLGELAAHLNALDPHNPAPAGRHS
ncbi:hydrolase [Planobispora rosea]|uniref:Hydrolase n=2 Tax=Planobispora rosea TaxID=35762 RepID=A0A8J3S0V4_PLARO|nr:hydrolase [Planobispora rosea]GIH83019.1 hydrolase [Planobispora rosea]